MFFYLSGGVAFHSLEDFFPQILRLSMINKIRSFTCCTNPVYRIRVVRILKKTKLERFIVLKNAKGYLALSCGYYY